MSLAFNPDSLEYTDNVVIGSETYIVTDFNDGDATPNGVDTSHSDGSYRGTRQTKGARNGSLTIQCLDADQPRPAQFATFTYKGLNWFILAAPKAVSSTGAATWSLSIRCTDIPSSVSTITVTAGGSGYTSAPTVTITGSADLTATATAAITGDAVTSVTITRKGYGYTEAPTIGFTGGEGTGATATATIVDPAL